MHPACCSTALHQVHYILSQPHPGWVSGTRGHITESLMRAHLFPAAPDTLGLMCGPPGLLDNVCVPGLTAMGYQPQSLITF